MNKKSLVESLKATKKANVVTAPAKNEGTSTRKIKMQLKASANLRRLRKVE